MIRGTLVACIFQKTTEISITALDNSAAVTLMSTDVERSVLALRQLHELWANVIQVIIATTLLQQELKYACIAPIVVAIGKLPYTTWLTSFLEVVLTIAPM
jgi:ATP-binding cassette subfamily C (CFTR/MRP) protein 1